jgi:hypothetical protein
VTLRATRSFGARPDRDDLSIYRGDNANILL